MSIWIYEPGAYSRWELSQAVQQERCLFCRFKLTLVHRESQSRVEHDIPIRDIATLYVRWCALCGWWTKRVSAQGISIEMNFLEIRELGAAGSLKDLNLQDIEMPLGEVRDFLTARYDARSDMSPRLFEDAVASVFADLGYCVVVTGKSGDGGIDAVMEGKDKSRIGVQVKRQRSKVVVEQIRGFLGALVLKGCTRGVFVTISTFTRASTQAASRAALAGYRVELMNATEFYEALRLAQRARYQDVEEKGTPFEQAPLVLISQDTV